MIYAPINAATATFLVESELVDVLDQAAVVATAAARDRLQVICGTAKRAYPELGITFEEEHLRGDPEPRLYFFTKHVLDGQDVRFGGAESSDAVAFLAFVEEFLVFWLEEVRMEIFIRERQPLQHLDVAA